MKNKHDALIALDEMLREQKNESDRFGDPDSIHVAEGAILYAHRIGVVDMATKHKLLKWVYANYV